MRIPESLASLAEYGIIEEVLRPLMSGKEAQIYLVISGGEQRVAKVYKEAQNRTFKNRAEYTEGRKVRNTRDQRAMGKGTRHGRAQVEAAWRATEVEMIYRLRDAGVRVPIPYHFIDSVLVMEMVADGAGNPAPRLGDLSLEPAEARVIFDRLLSEVVRMLSAGVVHGDLSDFNVLVGTDGPVVIDFPQAVDASSNQNARKLLVRDVDNLHNFMARFDPNYRRLPYAQEMWQLYERSQLAPDAKLSGRHRASEQKANTNAVLELIGDADHDERRRRQSLGMKTRGAPAAPRQEHARSAEPAQRGQTRPTEQAQHSHTRPAQETAPTPRRVEVVMTPATRRNGPPAGNRASTAHDTRPRDGGARNQGNRTHAVNTQPGNRTNVVDAQQGNRTNAGHTQQGNRTHAVNTQQGNRTNAGNTQQGNRASADNNNNNAREPQQARPPQAMRPSADAADPNAATAVKRRRRRRRRKPGSDVTKPPT